MHFLKKYPRLFKFTCYSTVVSGVGWLYNEIRKTQNILSNALDTSVLSILEPPAVMNENNDNFLIIDLERQDRGSYLENVIFYPERQWRNLKFVLAKHLIKLSNNDNLYIRTKAIKHLAKIKNLYEWQFQLLSNLVNSHTAVGLARSEDVDQNFFLKPHIRGESYSEKELVHDVKELLIGLNERSDHPCLQYFISKAFVDYHDVSHLVDFDSAPLELKEFIRASTHDIVPTCLESLLHHVSISGYGKDIAALNGIPLLMEIYSRFEDDSIMTGTICRILAYLSVYEELLEDLFKAGWIGVLAKLVKHDDIRISIPASKALANLDVDNDSIYNQRLYPLHPAIRNAGKFKADVIFVHGLLGGVFFTWRQRDKKRQTLGLLGKTTDNSLKESLTQEDTFDIPICKKRKKFTSSDPETKEFMLDFEECFEENYLLNRYEAVWDDLPINCGPNSKGPYSSPSFKCFRRPDNCYTYCWPRDWLAEDCEGLRIIGINYETNLSLWASICPTETVKTLEQRSEELILQLRKIGLGDRPIIWVTHSMGGLIVKDIICKSFESNDCKIRNISLNTKGVVFYSTPHTGSSVAKLNPATAYILWPSVEVQELVENSKVLLDIHNKFLDITKKIPMKLLTLVESKATEVTAMKFKFLIVEPASGNPGVGEYFEIPLDHLGICKPANRHSFLYQKVLFFIKEILSERR